MKAVISDGAGVRLETTAPVPTPRPGEALIRPRLVAVASLDALVARGDGPFGPFRGVLGHRFVGVVERVAPAGEGARAGTDLIGKRVVGSVTVVCGRCDMCRAGLSLHCRDAGVIGMKGRDGCIAEAFTLPVRNLVVVPDAIPDDAAIFAEPLSSALQAAQQVRVEGKPYITVLGDGPLGLLTAQVMARLNASVRLIGHHDEKIARCERWGIKHRLESDVGRRADQDVVVDCTGTESGLDAALAMVRPRGKVVVKSIVPGAKASRPADSQAGGALRLLVLKEIELVGSRSGSLADALAMLGAGGIDVSGLITRRLRLDHALEALRLVEGGEQIGVVIETG